MELETVAQNAFVVALKNGVRLLYSYGSPAAVYVPGRGFLKTNWYISRTTAAHVSAFIADDAKGAQYAPHDEIVKIAREA